MNMVKAKQIDGKKFMWDGRSYDNQEEAKNIESGYVSEGFETRIVQEDGKYNVYTRRLVTEVVVEGEAPL
jgi:hypothetical protein